MILIKNKITFKKLSKKKFGFNEHCWILCLNNQIIHDNIYYIIFPYYNSRINKYYKYITYRSVGNINSNCWYWKVIYPDYFKSENHGFDNLTEAKRFIANYFAQTRLDNGYKL